MSEIEILALSNLFMYRSIPVWFTQCKVKMGKITRSEQLANALAYYFKASFTTEKSFTM